MAPPRARLSDDRPGTVSARGNGSRRGSRRAPVSGARRDRGFERVQVSELQRARILAAMLDVSVEKGAANVTVAHVVERSGVSRRTFYDVFDDREDCFLAAFEQALAYASEHVLSAYESERGWREKIRAGLIALLSFLDREPVIGRVLVVESFGGGPRPLERRNEVIAQLTNAVERAREEAKASLTSTPLTGEGLVGGVLAVIHSRLSEKEHAPLVELTSPLMSMIVLPYLGTTAARREIERPAPAPDAGNSKTVFLADPFKGAGMRLTYRTVRVLVAIGENPGASNRLIGDAADIKDQGQISKLLTRLERAGMISNTGLGRGEGGPNSWTLTSSGRQVVSTVRAHTEGHPGHGER